jgi:hypothetical protein
MDGGQEGTLISEEAEGEPPLAHEQPRGASNSRSLTAPPQFYVYTHARPDGRVFYVGKGMDRRAWDFAPSRRTTHHVNIIRKYGAKNILVQTIPHADEMSAFTHERTLIASYKAAGIKLINLTDGGEGASGRPHNAAQAAGFALGRRSWAERKLSEEAMKAIRSGWTKGAAKRAAWQQTEDGKRHQRRIVELSAAEHLSRIPHEVVCVSCKKTFLTKARKTIYCGKKCGLQGWRLKGKADLDNRPPTLYSNNKTGVRGVYLNKNGTWKASYGRAGGLIHLGTFADRESAISARIEAERTYGRPATNRRPNVTP